MVHGVDSIQHYTRSGSITNPSESANPGMMAVGAAPWHNVHAIETYSSRGPTPDGRVKPDIVGADCGETALSPLNSRNRGFCGTSQAAPHVAGMAALVKQRFPAYTPAPGCRLPERPRAAAGNAGPQQHLGAWLRLTPVPGPGSAGRPLQRHRRPQLDEQRRLAEQRAHRPMARRHHRQRRPCHRTKPHQ